MTLMRAFGKVEKDGKISIPSNIRREARLEKGATVEIKVTGTQDAQYIVIRRREGGKTR
jgi:bifunctional DNA-binding transcriptional regulator/antitoxin component of YhaV-PrlF toxin-antitoxin module